jgi:hypothetical protein
MSANKERGGKLIIGKIGKNGNVFYGNWKNTFVEIIKIENYDWYCGRWRGGLLAGWAVLEPVMGASTVGNF